MESQLDNADSLPRADVSTCSPSRLAYVKPAILRVDLALEETLSAGCKMVDGCGADLFDPEGGLAGS